MQKGIYSEHNIQMVVFEISGKEYGISVYSTKEVIQIPDIVEIPNAPEFIAGVINLRGKIIAVVDLRKHFHFPGETTENSKIIIAKMNEMMIGLIVDRVYEVITISKSQIDLVPQILNARIPQNCLVGIAKVDQRIISLLNLDNVLSREQVAQLSTHSI
jgi:purine-binding chemotaxis protein CheW